LSADVLIPQIWRRTLAGIRILLAGCWLAAALTQQAAEGLAALAVASAYLAYAICVPLFKRLRRPSLAALTLAADTVMLLLALHSIAGPAAWLGVIWFAFLMVSAMIAHPWQQTVVIAAGCVAFLTVARPHRWDILALTCACLAALAVVAIRHRSQIEERLYGVSRQAVLFRSEAIQARESERLRIADDFHDGPLQIFMSLQMRLEVARRLLDKNPAAARKELEEMADLWKSQVVELRAFLRAMRSSQVEASELFATLSRTVDAFEKDTGIAAAFSASGSLELQQPGLAADIVQVVREALHNIRKHAQATHVSVQVSAAKGGVEIAVDDNGRGFPFAGSFNLEELDLLRIGPGSIKRRIHSMSGDLTVDSAPGRGTTLRARIPQ
jgi:signal transduction histidine kinase